MLAPKIACLKRVVLRMASNRTEAALRIAQKDHRRSGIRRRFPRAASHDTSLISTSLVFSLARFLPWLVARTTRMPHLCKFLRGPTPRESQMYETVKSDGPGQAYGGSYIKSPSPTALLLSSLFRSSPRIHVFSLDIVSRCPT